MNLSKTVFQIIWDVGNIAIKKKKNKKKNDSSSNTEDTENCCSIT